jgi:hypothetical protein
MAPRQRSRSSSAPREDGGTGRPGPQLRGDIAGDTPHGLAEARYVRESRRVHAERTAVEQDIALVVPGEHGAVEVEDFGPHPFVPDRPAPKVIAKS